jgi:hypothetical protein
MIERVFPDDVESQVKVIEQHSSYRAGHGLFGRPMALAAAETKIELTKNVYPSSILFQDILFVSSSQSIT